MNPFTFHFYSFDENRQETNNEFYLPPFTDQIFIKNPNGTIDDGEINYLENLGNVSALESKEIILDEISHLHLSEYKRASKLLSQTEEDLFNLPSSRDLKNTLTYLQNVAGKYLSWFRENNIIPPDLLEAEQKKLFSLQESIEKSVVFINSEINKLEGRYKQRDVIRLCKAAYENNILIENKKRILSVTKYAETIYPKLKHKFSDWTLKQFKKYLGNHLSSKSNYGKLNIIGIFFL